VIRLQNALREPRTYEIPISAGAGHVRENVTTVKRSLAQPTGSVPAGSLTLQISAPRTRTRQLPKSITLMAAGTAGDTSDALPDTVQHADPFKGLIAKRALKVVAVVEKPAESEPEANAAPKPDATHPKGPTKADKTEKTEKRGDK
jgi:hypothetical protein